jgi:hypothetical protein
MFARKYGEAFEARTRDRAAFKEAFTMRYGRRMAIHYPSDLNCLPKFADWLKEKVGKAMQSLDKPTRDVYEASCLLEQMATGYRAIYAHGMYLRIREAEEDKITSDSGVAAVVWERIRSTDTNAMDEVDNVEYVGSMEEILELSYRSHCCVVLLCSWIPGAQGIRNAKVERDRYGFLLGNFNSTMPVGPKSFAFPTQCQQVFFSSDENWNVERGGDWKVICDTEVRGRRGNLDLYHPDV